jgi:adenylate cyclase
LVIASIYSLIQKERTAESIYLGLVKKSPQNWRVYFSYGYFLTRTGRHKEAINYYKSVLRFLPQNVNAINNMAIGYMYLDDFEKSAEMFEMAAEIEQDPVVIINTGTMYYWSENFKKAVDLYKKAVDLEPENYQWIAYLGDAYKFVGGEKLQADKCFADVLNFTKLEIKANPSVAKPYQFLARANLYFGDIGEAKKNMEIADSIEPNTTEAYYSHLRIAVVEGNDEKTMHYARQLINNEYSVKLLLSDPDFKVLKQGKFEELKISSKGD